jgi:uncharacterized protein
MIADGRQAQRIAVVGAGVSGLVTAYLLSRRHEVILFEGRDRPGGHANTVDVDLDGQRLAVDTGFIVFNDRTYPNFCRLVEALGVASHGAPMTFGVRSDRSGLEYAVTSLGSLFAQRRNALRPSYYRFLADVARWNRLARRAGGPELATVPVHEFVASHRFSRQFVDEYLMPLGCAIWSCPPERLRGFPMRFLSQFLHNHGMLSWAGQPRWRTIRGGSRCYVAALLRSARAELRLKTPVRRIWRTASHVEVDSDKAAAERFDHVVLACHADQALAALADASAVERDLLSRFSYQRNVASLHTDTRVMPRQRRAWAAWNYRVPKDEGAPVSLTYAMNRLQALPAARELLVTINGEHEVRPAAVLGQWTYQHPVFTAATAAAQARHSELVGQNRTSFCGAYWGFGFHEDGVVSALRVCQAFGETL